MKITEKDKERIYNLYYKQNKSFRDIAKIYNCYSSTIIRWFKKWDFKPRDLKESCKLRCQLKPHTDPGRKDMKRPEPKYGSDNPAYKKGWWITHNGYKKISWLGNEVLEHHYVWSIVNKREIPKGHQVHHINGDKLDNRIENLVCLSNSEHQKLHNQSRDKINGRFINKEGDK